MARPSSRQNIATTLKMGNGLDATKLRKTEEHSDKHKLGEQLADALDFKATVLPGVRNGGFKLEVRVNLPAEPIIIDDNTSIVMVCESSGRSKNHYAWRVVLKIDTTKNVVESLLVGTIGALD